MNMMSVKAYAEARGLAVSTVRSLCKANVLPSIKIGVAWHIDVQAADEVFQARMRDRVTPVKIAPVKKPTIIPSRKKPINDYLERLKAL